ncbi:MULTISPECIES: DUF3784 domain-containing protein [unclassified Sedimentibacter]|uniref:DUF3784 domain-containing protein n=1 Tax=unclassified Sedimentibacter TaxID=2649220 RepID=UPI0027DFB05C|nr:DUF3784 domain-containing protein [Sedimentibacter sp. MB35-C1]WMJ77592.1 DUF3784 domain-containing protein [Sedimentibacter sp. MB35-C1]
MIIGLIIMLSAGLFCTCFGFLIWKKEKISLIHSYHYTNVKEKDKKAYTTLFGKGIVLIGTGCILAGILDYVTYTAYWWTCSVPFFIIGFILIGTAQKKYNGSLF